MLAPNNSKSILLIRAGRLGDTIWATSAIEPLRQHYGPDVEIDLLIHRGMEGLFRHDPRIRNIFQIHHRSLPIVLTKAKRNVLSWSRKKPYDLAVDLETGTDFLPLMARIIAHKKVIARDVLKDVPPMATHAVSYLRQVLSFCVPQELALSACPTLVVSDESINSFERFGIHGNYCVLHPGNSLVARNKPALRSWPIKHWRTLIGLLSEYFPDLQVVLVGEPKEMSYVDSIAAASPRILNLCGHTSLPELMEIISKANFLVSSDTGPSHLAAALGTPVISLFGPTDPELTGPLSCKKDRITVLRTNLSCSPCINHPDFDTCRSARCMEYLNPNQVVNAASTIGRF